MSSSHAVRDVSGLSVEAVRKVSGTPPPRLVPDSPAAPPRAGVSTLSGICPGFVQDNDLPIRDLSGLTRKDRIRESNRRQYVKNRERRLVAAKADYAANREARSAQRKEHRITHRAELGARDAIRYQRDRDKRLAYEREKRATGYHQAREHGLTIAEFSAMQVRQAGLCAICRLPMKRVCVDHDHRTGKVRGLLCHNCNVALGHLRDSAGLLFAAIAYLQGIR